MNNYLDYDEDGFTENIDCNDNDKFVYPGAPEIGCDLKDNNCDGIVDEEEIVHFEDEFFESCVKQKLGIEEFNYVINSEMCNFSVNSNGQQTFSCYINEISNIKGLEYAINLEEINFPFLNINDISALSGLTNLVWINLWGNHITDISALSGLTNLEGLNLHDNQISDISALSELTKLNRLYLHANQISDISALSELNNLVELYIYLNQISDISVLSGLTNLVELGISENQISDISALTGLTNLERLNLNNNQISDISALVDNSGLSGSGDSVYLRNNFLDLDDCNDINILLDRDVIVNGDVNCD